VAVGSAPIFAGLFAWPVLGHRPTGAWVAATGIAVSGLVLLSSDALAGSGGGIGVLLALAAGLANGSYNVATKPVLDTGVEPVELTAAAFTLAGFLLLPGLLTQPLGWLVSASGVGLALYLGIVTAAVANTWLAQGVHALGPGPASTLMLADPVTATVLGIVVLQEPITPAVAAGIALVLAGLAFQTAAVRRYRPQAALESADASTGS
jgi:DME family drug/metabolite transporter